MQNKLQALISEQKALTARFEELLYSTTEKSSTLDPKKVYIKGHPTRGAEVIKMLQDLGGIDNGWCKGSDDNLVYFINYKRNWSIDWLLVEDFRKIIKEYTELHLPEAVSTENPQTTDIKVGDWYLLDEPCLKCEISDRMKVEPFVIDKISASFDSDVAIAKFADGTQCDLYKLRDKFHKVEPPKDEVELIEGEVYARMGIDYVFILGKDYTALCRTGIHGFFCRKDNKLNFSNKEIITATPEQRKQLFDALEKAGKHFDKENMRLIDVEEWSCEQGLPFIARHHNKDKWKCVIFWEFYSVKGSAGKPVKLFKSNEYCDYKCAIPYNDQTKHLIGTTDNPNKHYKFVNKK